jgi:hypothetical protein
MINEILAKELKLCQIFYMGQQELGFCGVELHGPQAHSEFCF